MIKSKRGRWAGHVACAGAKRNTHSLLVGKPEENSSLGRQRHKWVNSIKMNLGEIEWGGVDWIGLARDRDQWVGLVNMAMNLQVPLHSGNFVSGYTTDGLTGSAQLHGVSYLLS
jgi:hypothetical protein